MQWNNDIWEYQNSPGEIKFWDNVIRAKSNDDAQIYQGWRLGVFETIRDSQGRFKSIFPDEYKKTWDLVVSTKGILHYLNTLIHDERKMCISFDSI